MLEPASIVLPEGVNQLLILNRLPASYRMIDVAKSKKLSRVQLMLLDTLVSNNVFRGLYDMLRESPLETFHYPIWSIDRQSEVLVDNEAILTKREVTDLCKINYSDVILSLESFFFQGNPQLTISPEGGQYYSYERQLISKSTWIVYLPQSPKPYNKYEVTDTMLVGAYKDFSPSIDLPSISLIRKMSYRSGQNYGKYVAPSWTNEKRDIYASGKGSLRRGSRFTKEGEWKKANRQWNELSVSGSSSDTLLKSDW